MMIDIVFFLVCFLSSLSSINWLSIINVMTLPMIFFVIFFCFTPFNWFVELVDRCKKKLAEIISPYNYILYCCLLGNLWYEYFFSAGDTLNIIIIIIIIIKVCQWYPNVMEWVFFFSFLTTCFSLFELEWIFFFFFILNWSICLGWLIEYWGSLDSWP